MESLFRKTMEDLSKVGQEDMEGPQSPPPAVASTSGSHNGRKRKLTRPQEQINLNQAEIESSAEQRSVAYTNGNEAGSSQQWQWRSPRKVKKCDIQGKSSKIVTVASFSSSDDSDNGEEKDDGIPLGATSKNFNHLRTPGRNQNCPGIGENMELDREDIYRNIPEAVGGERGGLIGEDDDMMDVGIARHLASALEIRGEDEESALGSSIDSQNIDLFSVSPPRDRKFMTD